MRIQRRSAEHGSILPSALSVIAAVPAQYLHYQAHGLRHPLSAYGTALRLITAEWTHVLDQLDELQSRFLANRDDTFLMDVARSYAGLLHKLNEQFDACYSVLRSLSPPPAGKSPLMHAQYLDRAKLVGWKQFREATRSYRETDIGLVVNALKHSQGELCPMYFHSEREFRPGYYLRGLLPGGILGPDPRLHPGGNAAISFARDMLVHLWWLYRTSDLLSAAISSYLDAEHAYRLVPQPYVLSEAKWVDVVRRCAAIRPEFFPNEWGLAYPRVIYQQDPEQLTIEFPTTARGHKMYGHVQVRTLTTVDGSHPAEKVPYLGSSVA